MYSQPVQICTSTAPQRRVPVWISGNALVSIIMVALCQTWLVPRWVTAFGRVNHLGTEPGRLRLNHPSVYVGKNEYWMWLRPPSGKHSKYSVTRIAGIPACSQLKALAVDGAGCLVNVVCI